MPIWSPPAETMELRLTLAAELYSFFKAGARSLDSYPELLQGQRNRLSRLLQQVKERTTLLKAFAETLGSDDLAVFLLVFTARTVGAAEGYVELLALTGPRLGGKTLLVNPAITLLGGMAKQRPAWSYVEPLPSHFLTSKVRADANASLPVLNKLQGRRLEVVPECGSLPLVADTVKSADGRQRRGGERSRQQLRPGRRHLVPGHVDVGAHAEHRLAVGRGRHGGRAEGV